MCFSEVHCFSYWRSVVPDLESKYGYSREGKGSVSFYKFLSQSSLNYTNLSTYTAISLKLTNYV